MYVSTVRHLAKSPITITISSNVIGAQTAVIYSAATQTKATLEIVLQVDQ